MGRGRRALICITGIVFCLQVDGPTTRRAYKRGGGGGGYNGICSVDGNSAGVFISKVSPGIFVIKENEVNTYYFRRTKPPAWTR